MESALFHRVQPHEYHRRFLVQGVRSDGRRVCDQRPVRIGARHFPHGCEGSASVRCGDSFYFAGVKCEIGAPGDTATVSKDMLFDSRPGVSRRSSSKLEGSDGDTTMTDSNDAVRGRVVVNVEFPRICGYDFDEPSHGGLHPNFCHKISESLTSILNSSEIIDLEKLRISDEAVWVLKVSVMCLQYDGNPVDFCLYAAVAALEDTVLRSVYWDKNFHWWRQGKNPNEKGQIDHVVDTRGDSIDAKMRQDEDSDATLQKSFDVATNRPQLDKRSNAYDDNSDVEPLECRGVKIKRRPVAVTFCHMLGEFWVSDPSKVEERLGKSISFIHLAGATPQQRRKSETDYHKHHRKPIKLSFSGTSIDVCSQNTSNSNEDTLRKAQESCQFGEEEEDKSRLHLLYPGGILSLNDSAIRSLTASAKKLFGKRKVYETNDIKI